MKKSVVAIRQATYRSNPSGVARLYLADDSLRQTLGQAKDLRVQAVGTRRDANTRVVIKVWESCYEDIRPTDFDASVTPFFTSSNIDTLRPVPQQVNGPFGEFVDVGIEVSDSTATLQVEWEGLIAITMILEE